jgi:hypothetical protein
VYFCCGSIICVIVFQILYFLIYLRNPFYDPVLVTCYTAGCIGLAPRYWQSFVSSSPPDRVPFSPAVEWVRETLASR